MELKLGEYIYIINEETGVLFNLQKFEYIDQSSLMYPHKSQQVLHNTEPPD